MKIRINLYSIGDLRGNSNYILRTFWKFESFRDKYRTFGNFFHKTVILKETEEKLSKIMQSLSLKSTRTYHKMQKVPQRLKSKKVPKGKKYYE